MSEKLARTNRHDRKGSVVVLVAILLPLFIALIAFAVDYGVIVVSRHELQNAADAASISTLETLVRNHDDADLAAFETLSASRLHGRSITFDMQQDVHYGSWNSETREFTETERNGTVASTGDTTGATIPNGVSAVRIRLSRTRERGNGIALVFGRLLGTAFAEINVEAISATTAGCNGFVGLESVRIHNNAKTDSYNSDEGNYGSGPVNQNGDVCSNGPVLLDYSSAMVRGDAEGSSIEIRNGSNGMITGSQSIASGIREEDPVDFSMTANDNDNDTIPPRPPYDYRGTSYVTDEGDFILDGGQRLTISSGVYHFRNMTVQGGGRLTIDGDVTIYIEREMRYDNGTSANPSAAPSELQILVGQGPVNLQGGHDLHAVIYAPEADVIIENNARFHGSIIGETLTVGGGAQLHYDESLASDADSGGPPSLVN